MATEASIAGVAAHGLRWRHQIHLGNWPAQLGKLNDRASDGEDIDDAEVEKAALGIVAAVRATYEREGWAKDTDLDRRADDLEMAADCGIEEVNFMMNELYDSFDYWRVLVVRP